MFQLRINYSTTLLKTVENSPNNTMTTNKYLFTRMFSIAMFTALSSCSTNTSLDHEALKTETSTTPAFAPEVTTDQPQSQTIDVGNALAGEEQTAMSSISTAAIGAAEPVHINNSAGSPNVEATVACNATMSLMQQRTLQLINEVRSQPQTCGSDAYQATTELSWSAHLQQAATQHSVDMTEHNFFDHTGSDGSTVATRVDATDYDWRAVGENIAAGQLTAHEAITDWLASPGHCKNLMNPAFTEVAVSCAEDVRADNTQYWTNVLATPQ